MLEAAFQASVRPDMLGVIGDIVAVAELGVRATDLWELEVVRRILGSCCPVHLFAPLLM